MAAWSSPLPPSSSSSSSLSSSSSSIEILPLPTISDEELERAVRSLKILLADDPDADKAIDWAAYRELLATSAHKSHKDWDETSKNAERLSDIVKGPGYAVFQRLFERVLVDGNWYGAEAEAAKRAGKPWAVLVTGVNGIRKTSSVYQPWFKEALKKALADQYSDQVMPPPAPTSTSLVSDLAAAAPSLNPEALTPQQADELPDGASSFFRQLDYMIATVANEDFRALYQIQDITLYASLVRAALSGVPAFQGLKFGPTKHLSCPPKAPTPDPTFERG